MFETINTRGYPFGGPFVCTRAVCKDGVFFGFAMDDGAELRFSGADVDVIVDDPMAMTADRR
jgi:hypothetical protein